ncbi:hypothetical protein QQP08_019454 [Theobroma cacao]|nr:hypothetical protein QQP08_019454 [Theobroma cacao]
MNFKEALTRNINEREVRTQGKVDMNKANVSRGKETKSIDDCAKEVKTILIEKDELNWLECSAQGQLRRLIPSRYFAFAPIEVNGKGFQVKALIKEVLSCEAISRCDELSSEPFGESDQGLKKSKVGMDRMTECAREGVQTLRQKRLRKEKWVKGG